VSYLNLKQVKEITQLSTATIYRLIAQGKFPKQFKLTERTSRWVGSEIEGFINQKIEERKG
jgi:prophage regulatory protein|tara:strand:+ start:381 stop:563 length:183 start_codon:yes stop_codon:yes gene_type:complete